MESDTGNSSSRVQNTLTQSKLQDSARALLEQVGWRGDFILSPLPGGTNNRLFHVRGEKFSALLKDYFRHAQDSRDRLGTEFAFCYFAWDNGVKAVPQPYCSDPERGLALYEYIAGQPVRAENIAEGLLDQALQFFKDINVHRDKPSARHLGLASDGCLSVTDHLNGVERRIKQLKSMDRDSKASQEAYNFVHEELEKTWFDIAEHVERECQGMGWPLGETIPLANRRLSPSDFGFHNAILTPQDRLRFIDFEYAGWDDPAKCVCDFFALRAVPVPTKFYRWFAQTIASDLPNPKDQARRMDLLLPVHQIKWCCILLNDFLEIASQRRGFAFGDSDDTRRQAQLSKAREALALIYKGDPWLTLIS